jgi:hypothetical protein
MKKYIYSPLHIGLVLAPLMEEPNVHDEKYYYSPGSEFAHFKKGAFYKDEAAYTSWLQETPLCLVRDEDIEFFREAREEGEFDVVKRNNPIQVFGGMTYYEERKVAIPKKKSNVPPLQSRTGAIEQELNGAVKDIDLIRIRLATGSSKEYLDIKLYELTNRIFKCLDLTTSADNQINQTNK